jgi:hypothetical protein
VLGIGGGGDVIGSLALARRCEELGTQFVLGGVAWERMPIDPHPGPRPSEEILNGQPLGPRAVLAGPQTSTPEGVAFSETHAAGHLGAETVLIDVSRGATGAARGIRDAARELDCDLALYVDVGGDAIALGDEDGLASPLCDAVMLAAGLRLSDELPGLLAVLGPGCDGELTPEQVLERIAALARAGAWCGTWSVSSSIADEVEVAARRSKTEASMQVVRCARGETGMAEIRGGRRHVPLGPVGALAFVFELPAAGPELALARAVSESGELEAARATLDELGVRSELDYERSRAGEGP